MITEGLFINLLGVVQARFHGPSEEERQVRKTGCCAQRGHAHADTRVVEELRENALNEGLMVVISQGLRGHDARFVRLAPTTGRDPN
jgi:hypothetical protein